MNIYWVDEDYTLVLRKTIYPYEDVYMDAIHRNHIWCITMVKLKVSKIQECKNKSGGGNVGTAPSTAAHHNYLGESTEEDEGFEVDPATAAAGEEGGEHKVVQDEHHGKENNEEEENLYNSCMMFKASDNMLEQNTKNISLIWIPHESITVSRRIRPVSTLYKIPNHYNNYHPLVVRNQGVLPGAKVGNMIPLPQPSILTTATTGIMNNPQAALAASNGNNSNYMNPHVTIQVFDSKLITNVHQNHTHTNTISQSKKGARSRTVSMNK